MYEEAKDVVNLGRSARCGCSEARGGGGGGGCGSCGGCGGCGGGGRIRSGRVPTPPPPREPIFKGPTGPPATTGVYNSLDALCRNGLIVLSLVI